MSGNDNGNSGIALVVLACLGFVGIIALIITGKIILDDKKAEDGKVYIQNINKPEQVPTAPIVQNPAPIAAPAPIPRERPNPEYHRRSNFWVGYNDGWHKIPPKSSDKEYMSGYEIGRSDARRNCRDYYDHHCPPDLNIRFKGFNLNIR